jgi:hypothetical protein
MAGTEVDDAWFAARKSGRGPGMPDAWQGWAVTALFVLVMTGAALIMPERSLVGFLAIAFGATASYLMVCAHKTEGGWQWHGGGVTSRRLLLALVAGVLVVIGSLLAALT